MVLAHGPERQAGPRPGEDQGDREGEREGDIDESVLAEEEPADAEQIAEAGKMQVEPRDIAFLQFTSG